MSLKNADFRHTCGLCTEPYKGRQPKLLPCFHTFCLPCLVTLAASGTASPATENENMEETNDQTAGSESENRKEPSGGDGGAGDGGKDVFLCPTCRHPVTVPEGGVANLQTNYYLDFEEAEEPRRPLLCEMCEEEEPQDATHACDTCQRRMCRTCRRFHDMFTDKRTHVVRSLGPQDQQQVQNHEHEAKSNCPVHRGQALCFHCQKCDISICLHCKLTSHEGHVTEDLAAAARRPKKELATLVVTANQQIQVLQASLDRLNRDEHELNRQEKEMTQEVSMRYDALITRATRARDEFLEELTKRKRAAQNNIQAEKTSAGNTAETLSRFVTQARHSSAEGADVVVLKNELQSALLSEDALEEHNKRAARENHLKFFACDVDTSAAELDNVLAYMGQLRDVDQNSLTAETAVSLRKLADDVAEIQTYIRQISGTVSFFVRLTEDRSRTTVFLSEILKFETIELNEHDGYDRGTGVFTAPVKGLYVFLLTVTSRSSDGKSDVVIVVNELEKAHVYCTGNSSGSGHIIVNLDAGDRVAASRRGGHYVPNSTTFCGALLRAHV